MKDHAIRILMILDQEFIDDPRVRREAFKLAELGYKLRVISLNPNNGIGRTIVNEIPVYAMPLIRLFKKSTRRGSRLAVLSNRLISSLGYATEYFYFAILCSILFAFVAVRDGFDVIHIHNPPNVLCLLALTYRLLGKKIVFDHHDLEPELYLSRYRLRANILYRLLVIIEGLCIRFSNMVIATNESYRAIEINRGRVDPEKIFVVRNGPDRADLLDGYADDSPRNSTHTKLVCVGVMGPQDGVDYLLRAIHHLRYGLGRRDFSCVIVGPGDALPDLKAYAKELDLCAEVEFTGYIAKSDLVRHLSSADICLDPNPSSPLNDHSTWIKVMEYMAFRKPIVSFDLKETRYTARESAVYVTPNDVQEYARAIAALMDDPTLRKRMGEIGYARIKNALAWEMVSENLRCAYDWLFKKKAH